jgi:hypothetical protein
MFTHWHALLGDQAYALLGEGLRRIELRQNLVGPREAARARTASATYFLNRPVEPSFDGCGGGVNVLSVQTQTRF